MRMISVAFVICTINAAWAQETRTAFEFSRPLDTCDDDADRSLSGTSRIIYSWNDDDPTNGSSPEYHGSNQRGAQSVNVVASQPNFPVVEDDIVTVDLTVQDLTIPDGLDTEYACKVFTLPTDQTYHIVSFEMIINETNFVNVHHALLYECPDVDIAGDGLTDGLQAPCGSGLEMHPGDHPNSNCQTRATIWAWAVGGSESVLPPNVGYPVGAGYTSSFLIQIHYDMPDLRGITDNSGIRLRMTPTLREHEADVLVAGLAALPFSLAIPPGETNYKATGYCANEGLGNKIANTPGGNITMFSTFMHAHLAGRRITLRHVRNGIELPVLADDPTYDFEYQQYLWFDEHVTMLPEDDLILECFYDTTDRTEVTFGGEKTNEEMCLAFVMFYPRLPGGSTCASLPLPNNETHITTLANDLEGNLLPMNTSRPVITTPFVEVRSCDGTEAHPRYGSSVPQALEVSSMAEWRASFEFSQVLGQDPDDDGYVMYWTTDADNGTVRFGVDVATGGWVGFGFSTNGGMAGADVIMAWVDDDTQELFFADRSAAAQALPAVDVNQDYFGIRGVQYSVGTPCTSHDDCLDNAFCDSNRLCRFCLDGVCPGPDSQGTTDEGTSQNGGNNFEGWMIAIGVVLGIAFGIAAASAVCHARHKGPVSSSGGGGRSATSTRKGIEAAPLNLADES